jgi:hypothetical protein
MKWLIAVAAAIGAAAVAVFLWRRNPGGVEARATDAASSVGSAAEVVKDAVRQ